MRLIWGVILTSIFSQAIFINSDIQDLQSQKSVGAVVEQKDPVILDGNQFSNKVTGEITSDGSVVHLDIEGGKIYFEDSHVLIEEEPHEGSNSENSLTKFSPLPDRSSETSDAVHDSEVRKIEELEGEIEELEEELHIKPHHHYVDVEGSGNDLDQFEEIVIFSTQKPREKSESSWTKNAYYLLATVGVLSAFVSIPYCFSRACLEDDEEKIIVPAAQKRDSAGSVVGYDSFAESTTTKPLVDVSSI